MGRQLLVFLILGTIVVCVVVNLGVGQPSNKPVVPESIPVKPPTEIGGQIVSGIMTVFGEYTIMVIFLILLIGFLFLKTAHMAVQNRPVSALVVLGVLAFLLGTTAVAIVYPPSMFYMVFVDLLLFGVAAIYLFTSKGYTVNKIETGVTGKTKSRYLSMGNRQTAFGPPQGVDMSPSTTFNQQIGSATDKLFQPEPLQPYDGITYFDQPSSFRQMDGKD